MKKSLLVVLMCAFAVLLAAAHNKAAAAEATASAPAKGDMLYDVNGRRLAPVYRVTEDGAVEIIIEDRMVHVPGSTVSMTGGKLTTSLTKPQVVELR